MAEYDRAAEEMAADYVARLKLENIKLKAALKKYGSHQDGCTFEHTYDPDQAAVIPGRCTCGLDNALKGGE